MPDLSRLIEATVDVCDPDRCLCIQARLLDRAQPLAKRMRVVCSLRAVAGQGTVEALASCLNDESALLRHEVAYALGQKEEASAVGVLIKALREDKDSMVRHEAAEALGAINVAEAEKVLEEFENSECEPLAHTCQLALDRIRWARSNNKADKNEGTDLSPPALPSNATRPGHAQHPPNTPCLDFPQRHSIGTQAPSTHRGALLTPAMSRPRTDADGKRYVSIDPAPPADSSLTVDEHVARLLDPKIRLFERYGNLFALRDLGTNDAVLGLAKVLLEDTSSAVLRHEVAFVLGQCANKLALPSLVASLENLEENQMVRHEAAEAIGAISEESATPLLQKFAKDPNRVVAESCEIALDISDYNNDDSQFEYADVDVKSS